MRRLLLAALLLLPIAAHAQLISIYGTYSATQLNGLVDSATASNAPVTTTVWTSGFGGGLTYGVLPLGPIRIGFDIRGYTRPGTNGQDLFIAGPRVALKLPFLKLKPFVEAAGGYLRTRNSFTNGPSVSNTQLNTYGAYEILGGVDYALIHFIDLRLIEVGGGKAYNSGVLAPASISLLTINSGVVVHF